MDFPYSSQEYNIYPGNILINKSIFDLFSFNAAFEKTLEYKKNSLLPEIKEFDFCTFMFNGFYEDGIDVILKTIKQSTNKKIKIAIKIPNYDSVHMNCYPGHNEVSKKYKCSSLLDKKIKEENLLKAKIYEMGLAENVICIKSVMTMFDAFDFMRKGKTTVLLNRGQSSHFLIYASIFFNQKPIITEHSIFDERLKKYCLCVKTYTSSFAEIKSLPVTTENISRLAQQIDEESFFNLLISIYRDNEEKETPSIHDSLIAEYKNKLNNFVINF